MLNEGTPDSVAMLNTGLCRQWHRRVFTPDNCLLVAVGNFEPKEFAKVLDKHFGKRKGEAPEHPEERLRPLTTYRPRRTTLHRDVEQAMCIVGWPAPSLERMEDAVSLKVVASIMGGGMSSRFFQILRDKMGLAYSVGCSYALRRSTGHFFAHIGTHPMQSAMATRGIVQMMQYLGREPVPAEELQRAKTFLKGIHLIDHQTNARQAWHLGWGELVGLGTTFDAQWPALIDAVTVERVTDIVKRYVTTPTMVTLRPHPPRREFPDEQPTESLTR
jgi:predicted Zn-dependent peptidase